jgi:hypothetical protein
MASVKEQFSAHCDKLAFGIVGMLIIAMAAVTMTGDDPIKTSQSKIVQHQLKIAETKNYQKELKPVEPPDVAKKQAQRWSRAAIAKDGFTPFVMDAQPAVLRIVTKAATNKSVHNPGPVITGITVARDLELKKPVITVAFKFGNLIEVTDVSADVERRVAGTSAWKFLVNVPYVEGTEAYTVVDAAVDASASYMYRVKSRAKGTKEWAEGSAADKDGVQPCVPPEADAATYKIPADMRIMFVQGKATDLSGSGEGYFNVEVYDYAKGKGEPERMIKRDELLGQNRKPVDKDLLPRTKFYLNVVKQGDKSGLIAVLKNVETRKEIQLPQGKWVPESIECPAAWAAAVVSIAPAEEPAATAEPAAGSGEATETTSEPAAKEEPAAATPEEPKQGAADAPEEEKSSETEEETTKADAGGRFK